MIPKESPMYKKDCTTVQSAHASGYEVINSVPRAAHPHTKCFL